MSCSSPVDRLLLVQQARGDEKYWLLPGGGLAMGETLADCARRELREELQLDIEPGQPLALVESVSPDQTAYPKHVLHVVLAATLSLDSAALRTADLCRRPIAPCCGRSSYPGPSWPALDLRPPIADFLGTCLEKLPTHLVYLGRRW